MIMDRTHGNTADTALPETRWIHPAIIVPLDEETAQLGTRVLLALGRRHPAAIPFFCALPTAEASQSPRPLDPALRRAFELVTDLGARQEAILAGNQLEDAVRVYLPIFLGSPVEESYIVAAVEAVHRVAAEYFDQTRFELHLLALLPDLADSPDRQPRYARAYQQLATLDRLGDPARPLGLRDRAATDFRWILDCRTRSGAYAGSIHDVLEPIVEMIALLLEGRSIDPIRSVDNGGDHLATKIHDRVAGYSTFGTGLIVHRRRQLARLLAAEAALEYLREYGLSTPGFQPEKGEQRAAEPRPDPALVESLLLDWAREVMLADRLRALYAEVALAPTGDQIARDQSRMRQQCRREAMLAAVESKLESAIRRWLEAHGLALADAALRAICEGMPEIIEYDALAVMVPELRANVRFDLERFLQLAELRRRIRELADAEAAARADAQARRQEETPSPIEPEGGAAATHGADQGAPARGAAEPNTTPGEAEEARATDEMERIAKERVAIEQELQRREALLDPAIDLDRLEEELLAIAALYRPDPVAAAPGEDKPPASPPPVERAAGRARIFAGLRRTFSRSAARPEPTVPPPVSTPTTPLAAERINPDPATARTIVERIRWIDAYTTLLGRFQQALGTHTSHIAAATKYYENTVKALGEIVTRSTNFTISTIRGSALERYRSIYVGEIRDALTAWSQGGWLAGRFRLESPELRELEHPLNAALEGFDEMLDTITRERLAPLLAETIADVLAERTQVGKLGTLRNIARTLVETSQPLARPTTYQPGASGVHRWMLAGDAALDLFQDDSAAKSILDRENCRTLRIPDDEAIVFFSAHHGFPAHAIRKLLAFRSEHLHSPGTVPLDDDPVSLEALAVGDTERALRTLILARRLRLVDNDTGGIRVTEGMILPADLAEAVRMITYESQARAAQQVLEARIDELLLSADGSDRLREAAKALDLTPLESKILLEMLAEIAPEPVVAE